MIVVDFCYGFSVYDTLGFEWVIDCIYVLGIMLNENGDWFWYYWEI